MTDPLTPPDCDLRDFAFMPMDIVRLFGSRFHAVASDAEWRAGVTLWLKSFHQVPAASLPDDDVELARLAELGRDIRTWRKLRDGALHGWVKCNDGRLYHPVVAEKAVEAWKKKEFYRERSRKANAKRWSGDHPRDEHGALEAAKSGSGGGTRSNGHAVHEASFKDEPRTPSASQGTVRVKGQEEVQLANANCASAENSAAAQPDADKQFWDSAKAYLGPRKASMIGKWCSQYGQPDTAKAITAAQIARAVDPIPYIERTLRNGKSEADEVPIC